MFSRLAEGRQNNFLLLRFIAAAAVIVSHSYPLALGNRTMEPLQQFGPTLGTIAVWAFFGVSGFLIFKSFERRPLPAFAAARTKRVFPALIVVSVLSVFVIGPLFTVLPLHDYFAARQTWEYVPRAISLKWVTFALPGVFADNPYPAVNGPLWTLYYEVFCYITLALAGVIGLLKRFPLFLVLAACGYALARNTSYAPLCLAFVTGMVLYRYRANIPAWAVILPWAAVPFTSAAIPAAVAATALWLAALQPVRFIRGDYSYGLYIYGFLVQEMVMSVLPRLGPVQLTLVALPITLLCAVCSWRFIEKPALEWKYSLQRRRYAGEAVL